MLLRPSSPWPQGRAFRFGSAAALLFAALFVACERSPTPAPSEGVDAVTPPPIEQVVDRHAPALMQIEGVTMVYAGLTEDERPCIRVGFVTLPHANQDRVPKELEGWPVVVEESGEIRPLSGGD